ncbi:hypothetical protein QNH14_05495 [Apirhabdus apintestini]|nr:hypothetical protein QNH14_05495 [Enterobacteriaceae bacterium CA-0114]
MAPGIFAGRFAISKLLSQVFVTYRADAGHHVRALYQAGAALFVDGSFAGN